MPIASVKGFVLGSEIINEQDKLITILTERSGVLRGVAPGACKSVNRFGSVLELFTHGDFRYNWKENRNLVTIASGDIVHSYFATVSKQENIFVFYLIAEILLKLVPVENSDSRVFRLVKAVLDAVENGEDLKACLAYFLVWILRLEGFMFNPSACSSCGESIVSEAWLRDDFRGILCSSCRSDEREYMAAGELDFIRWSEKKGPKNLAEFKDIGYAVFVKRMVRKAEVHAEVNLKSIYCISFIS